MPSFFKCHFKDIQWTRVAFDSAFWGLGAYAFYRSSVLGVLGGGVILALAATTKRYKRDMRVVILDHFIDFLNHLNAHLSIGMGFENAVLECARHEADGPTEALGRAIQMGISSVQINTMLCTFFPIPEAQRFGAMMEVSKETGASADKISETIIDKLYIKHKTGAEVETILFQKRMEQALLCLAPIGIVLFIRSTSPEYLGILYDTLAGRLLMTGAFALIIAMKIISQRLIHKAFQI